MKKELFQVEFRVHPNPDHPFAGEKFQFGILIFWIYGHTAKEAGETAVKIMALLPYKAIGYAKSFPYAEDETLQPYQLECVTKAKIIGFNIALFHYPKGTDENAVLGHWPLLVPPLNDR